MCGTPPAAAAAAASTTLSTVGGGGTGNRHRMSSSLPRQDRTHDNGVDRRETAILADTPGTPFATAVRPAQASGVMPRRIASKIAAHSSRAAAGSGALAT